MASSFNTDSPVSRRIASGFFDFLNSVEPASGVDLEGLEVVKDVLVEVFKIDPSSMENRRDRDLMVNAFSSRVEADKQEHKPDSSHRTQSAAAHHTSPLENASNTRHAETSQTLGDDSSREAQISGVSEDELFGQYFGALEKAYYFETTSDGNDEQAQLDRATRLFHNAVMEMKKSGCQLFDVKNLADALKVQGNKALQSKVYSEAIELYTLAIALYEDNAVYYCNRAAAYTQIQLYSEAIRDCLKSIEINPTYSKAYSRLGFAYYARGNYRDAIDKGFLKALQLDPNNDSVKENIRVAEEKLREEQRTSGHYQNFSSASYHGSSQQQDAGGSGRHATASFTAVPVDVNSLPSNVASMLRNVAASMRQEQSQGRGEAHSNSPDATNGPEIRMGDNNINFNLGGQMPGQLSGTIRTVMDLFTGGASPPANQPDNSNGRSTAS